MAQLIVWHSLLCIYALYCFDSNFMIFYYCEDRLEDSLRVAVKDGKNALRMVMATGGWLPQASPFLMKAGSGAAPVNVNTQLSAAESRKTTVAGGADTRNEPSSVVFALYLFHTGFGEGDRCRWFTELIQWLYSYLMLSPIFRHLPETFGACFQVHALAFIMECQHTVVLVLPRVVQCWVAPKEALWSLALALLAIDFGVQWIFHTCGMLDWC